MFCVVCDAGEFEGCNSVLQAGFYIRFRWLRVSPQMILQLNHTRVHNPQAAPLSLPPHHFQWAVTVTSLVSGGGGRRGGRRGGGLAAAGESATSPPRCFQTHSGWGVERNGAEPWASFKNLTLLLPTTRWFTALESPLAELWRYEPRTRCSTKVSFLFLTCLKQRERNIFFSCPGVPLAARVSGARRQSPNKLFLRGGGREEKRRILDSQQPPVFFSFGQFGRSFIVWPWKMWCVGSIADFGGAALGVDGAFPPLHMGTSPRLVVPYQVVGVGTAVRIKATSWTTSCPWQHVASTNRLWRATEIVWGWHATNKAQQQVVKTLKCFIKTNFFFSRAW